MASAVVLIVIAFVYHFGLTKFFKRVLMVATITLVFCMCCLYLNVFSKVTHIYLTCAVFSRSTAFYETFNDPFDSLLHR